MEVFAFCFGVGLVTQYFAKKKEKNSWRWGALGFFIFGPVIYMGVSVLIAAVVDGYYNHNYSLALFVLIIAIIILGYRQKSSKNKLGVDLKKSPKCQAFQDAQRKTPLMVPRK